MAVLSSLVASLHFRLRFWRWSAAALLTATAAHAHFPFSYSAAEAIGVVDVALPPSSGVTVDVPNIKKEPSYDYLRLQPLVAGQTWQYRGTISNTRTTLPAELKVEVLSAGRSGADASLVVEYTIRHTVTFGSATAITTISGVVSPSGDRILTTKTVSTTPGLSALERTLGDGGLRNLPRRMTATGGGVVSSYARMTEVVAGTPTAGLGSRMSTSIGPPLSLTTDLGQFETVPVRQQLDFGSLNGLAPVFSADGGLSYFSSFTSRPPAILVTTEYAAEVGPVRYTWAQSEPQKETVSGTLQLVLTNFPVAPRPLLQPQFMAGPESQALEPGSALTFTADVIGIPVAATGLPVNTEPGSSHPLADETVGRRLRPASADSTPSSTPVTTSEGLQYHWTTPRGERWTQSANFYLASVTTADAGVYQLEVISPTGAAQSAPARVMITPATANSRLINVASRAPSGREADTLIAGVVLNPSPAGTSATRRLLFRAVGPTLRTFGIADAEPDPTLVIFDAANREIARCDNWDSSRDAAERVAAAVTALGTFPLPAGSRDAALVLDLAPGAYTAHLLGAGDGAPAVGLVEIYDAGAGTGAGPRIANLSTRCRIGQGDRILIPGIVVTEGTARLLVRALGPALRQYGITDALPDPEFTLYAADGTLVASNDNWILPASAEAAGGTPRPPSVTQAAQLSGAAPLNYGAGDAAVVATLPRGSYTLHVRSRNPLQTGVVSAEVFLLNP